MEKCINCERNETDGISSKYCPTCKMKANVARDIYARRKGDIKKFLEDKARELDGLEFVALSENTPPMEVPFGALADRIREFVRTQM